MKRTRKSKTPQTSIGDEFIGTKFGPNGCLEVVAWCGEKSFYNKKYTVFCSVCAEDPELFGLGLFLITKPKFDLGRIPCGCSKSIREWSEGQYVVKILREIERKEFKYEFLGFAEPFKGRHTKLLLSSELGISKSASITNFLRGSHCKLYADMIGGIKNRKDDVDCIEGFIRTGSYIEGTIFKRSEVKDSNGWNCLWNVYCPTCNESYRAHLSNLSTGCKGCSCSQRTHNKAYIHTVEFQQATIALKYGITSVENQRRLKAQNKKSPLDLYEVSMWKFAEVSSCRRAEQVCKSLYNNYLTKDLLPDGYTETASVLEFPNIVKIFEDHGGVKIE